MRTPHEGPLTEGWKKGARGKGKTSAEQMAIAFGALHFAGNGNGSSSNSRHTAQHSNYQQFTTILAPPLG